MQGKSSNIFRENHIIPEIFLPLQAKSKDVRRKEGINRFEPC